MACREPQFLCKGALYLKTFETNGLENNEAPGHPVLPSVTLAVSEIITRKERCVSSF